MDVIQTSNKHADKFGAGLHGFSAGSPGSGIPATNLSQEWCDNVQQEIVNAILGSGATLNPASKTQLRDAINFSGSKVASAGGTADAITAAYTPAITQLVNGMIVHVRAVNPNGSTTPTFTPNSGVIAAKAIVKDSNAALLPGDIAGAGHWLALQYDQPLDKWLLRNPKTASGAVPLTGDATKTGKLTMNGQALSLITDYIAEFISSGGTANAGRTLFSQNSLNALAIAPSGTGGATARVDLQWIVRADGSLVSVPLRLNYDGTVGFSAGTLAAPSIAAQNDVNTGLYFPGADYLGAVVGGIEAWRVDPSRNFGVNTVGFGASNSSGFSVEPYAGGVVANVGHNGGAASGDAFVNYRRLGSILGGIYMVSSTDIGISSATELSLAVGGSAKFSVGSAGQWRIAGAAGSANQAMVSGGPSGAASWAGVLGPGQSWSANLAPSGANTRQSGVTYTNTTSAPREVILSYSGTSGATVSVAGTQIVNSGASNINAVMSFIVPAGATYVATIGGGITSWNELG